VQCNRVGAFLILTRHRTSCAANMTPPVATTQQGSIGLYVPNPDTSSHQLRGEHDAARRDHPAAQAVRDASRDLRHQPHDGQQRKREQRPAEALRRHKGGAAFEGLEEAPATRGAAGLRCKTNRMYLVLFGMQNVTFVQVACSPSNSVLLCMPNGTNSCRSDIGKQMLPRKRSTQLIGRAPNRDHMSYAACQIGPTAPSCMRSAKAS
jgi:hypothetical protein